MLKFKTEQYQNGFYSLKDYMMTMGGHTLVCLMPSKLRKLIYLKFLREKSVKNRHKTCKNKRNML